MLLIISWFLFFSITIEASWTIDRGCREAYTSPVGVLQFRDTYKDMKSWTLYCEYNITVHQSKRIIVDLLKLSMNSTIHCKHSYLSLKNGLTASSPSLGENKYCNNKQIGILQTTGNELGIHSIIELGRGAHYLLQYEEIPSTCSEVYPLFSSPPRQSIEIDESVSDCTWVFIAAVHRILTIESTSCDNEHLEIRDGGTELSPLISESCPMNGQKISTSGNLMYMKLRAEGRAGKSFHAHVEAVDRPCGGTLRLRDGVIKSPDYAFLSQNKICKWKIIAPEKKRIVFKFQDLHLPDSVNCHKKSHVRITERAPGSGNNRILGTFCGSDIPNEIETSCNKATIKFRNDYHNIGNFRGFVLNFTMTDASCSNECGGLLTSESGIINSPNFPNDYGSNEHCEWTIHLSKSKRIMFSFFGVIIDNSPSCHEDYLQIKEIVNGREKNLAVYCNDSDPAPLLTSSSMAKIIFHSDSKNEDSGFQLTYSAVKKSTSNKPAVL